MRLSGKNLFVLLVVLIIILAFYRIIPDRPYGFAPHLAMALFGGAVIRDKRWAFAFPVFSIFISDLIYQLLWLEGLSPIRGFYEGQITNYVLLAVITAVGFLMKRISVLSVAFFSGLVSVLFFLLSNFFVWFNGGGLERPRNFAGLLQCYVDAIPFFQNSLIATLSFGGLLFGGWYLIQTRLKSVVNQ